MSYIEETLMSGESVIKKTQLHWIVYLPFVILLALAALLFAVVIGGGEATRSAMPTPVIFLTIAIFAGLAALIKRKTSEFAVTNKRVVIKIGWLRRRSSEILLKQVEGITVDQGILGRVFDYGTIIVEGTGTDRTRYKGISGPLKFRLAVQEQIEASLSQGFQTSHPAIQPVSDPPRDPYDRLLKLNELKEKGVLTDEEFQTEKRKVLGGS